MGAESTDNFFVTRRRELELTQLALAIALGVTPSTIANWESGLSFPRRRAWAAVAAAYQTTLEQIAAAALATAGSS